MQRQWCDKTPDHPTKDEIMEITKGSPGSNEAHQITLEHDWINRPSVSDLDSLYLVIKEIGQMTSVHGMSEHARGYLKKT